MEDNREILCVPYAVYESMLFKDERHITKLILVIILLITMLVLSNVCWIIAWSQYDYIDGEVYEIVAEQDGEGVNIVGAGGDIYNGADS